MSERPRPARLYKYASPQTARNILDSGRVWWSRPDLLDDIFDMQLSPQLGCTMAALADAFAPMGADRILSVEPLSPQCDSNLAALILADRPRAAGVARDEIIANMRASMLANDSLAAGLADADRQLRTWADRTRVFCVSEVWDEPTMWALYAQRSQGVVFELATLPDERGTLSHAVPIHYADVTPVMGAAQEWADHLLGVRSLDLGDYFHRLLWTKHSNWAAQREWRCFVYDAEPASDVDGKPGVYAVPFFRGELTGVYLGANISRADRSAIERSIRGRVSGVTIHLTSKKADGFGLDLRRIA